LAQLNSYIFQLQLSYQDIKRDENMNPMTYRQKQVARKKSMVSLRGLKWKPAYNNRSPEKLKAYLNSIKERKFRKFCKKHGMPWQIDYIEYRIDRLEIELIKRKRNQKLLEARERDVNEKKRLLETFNFKWKTRYAHYSVERLVEIVSRATRIKAISDRQKKKILKTFQIKNPKRFDKMSSEQFVRIVGEEAYKQSLNKKAQEQRRIKKVEKYKAIVAKQELPWRESYANLHNEAELRELLKRKKQSKKDDGQVGLYSWGRKNRVSHQMLSSLRLAGVISTRPYATNQVGYVVNPTTLEKELQSPAVHEAILRLPTGEGPQRIARLKKRRDMLQHWPFAPNK